MAEPKFEKDLERLEEIVSALEEGELPLDDALKRFEEGIKLAKRCEKALSEAEKKIEILTKNADGKLEAQPFGDDDEDSSGAEPARPKSAQSKKDADGDSEDGSLLF